MVDPKPDWQKETIIGGDAGTAAAVRSQSSSAAPTIGPSGIPPSSPVLGIGTVLVDRYEVQAILGQGGMGAVYKAYDRELDRFVAIKTIRPELAGYDEMLQRFKQELILARSVGHRNIVRLYDIADAGGVKFITMEFIDGDDFRSILRRQGKFTADEAIHVIRQICLALEAAHAEGIIHRDLKPQNILRDNNNGRIVVMDFGLARGLESSGMTQTGMMLGTMEYMSPEQARGEQVDRTSDIYAAGLIFYELLTGKMPFAAESALASLMKRAQERAIPANEIERSVPRHLSAIVSHCIEPDRKKRYQSATDILADLDALSPNSRAATVMVPRPAAASHTYKWVSIGLGCVVATFILSFVGWRYLRPAAPAAHAPVSVLVADFENHTGDPIFDGTFEPTFNAALEGASFINTFNRGEAHKLASQLPNHPGSKVDEQSARLIAASQMIGAVVTGSISRRGDGYKISVEAMNGISGNSIASAEDTVANKDEVMLAIPKLAAPIRKALGDTTPESVQLSKSQGGFRVGSLEAAHLYGIGMEQQFSGNWKGSLQSLSKAVELDPDFGRAYYAMAADTINLGMHDEAQNAFKQALAHVDRMTERERFRIRGGYYSFIGNYAKCIEEYGALVTQFPADNIGHTNVAICYERLRNMPKALDEARESVKVVPRGAVQHQNLSIYSIYAGDFAGGESEAREVFKLNPTYDDAFESLADAQIGLGKVQEAHDTYLQLQKLGTSPATASLGLAEVASYSGQFTEAGRILRAGITSDLASKAIESAAAKYVSLALSQASTSQTKLAVESAHRAASISKSIETRFMTGRVLAEAGQDAAAHQIAVGLSADPLVEPQAYSRIIDGLIALQHKDLQKAIQSFTDANKILNTWIGHFDLGRAYLAAHQFAEASSEFDLCVRRRGESIELLDSGPTYSFLPPIYYYQAQALAGLQSRGFVDSLQAYLAIRGDSKDDPLVAEARRQLASAPAK